jgi:SAM-dependent methyltransferase
VNTRVLRSWTPSWLAAYALHFEASIERSVESFSCALASGSRVLDAGAGEAQYRKRFGQHRYVAVDLGIGDSSWDYARLDAVADLARLPFRSGSFDAALSVVTLEHVTDPCSVLREMARTIRDGGSLLLIVPQEWEVHQAPHDYFRYTRYGARHLLEAAGFTSISIEPVGGFFRLLSRRLLNGLQFFPVILLPLTLILLAVPALILPLLDPLDRERSFTLGYVCRARKGRQAA